MALVNTPVLYPGIPLIGALQGANFATTADQPIPLLYPTGNGFRLNNFLITNGQGNITGAVGGFFTDVNKGGTTLVASTQAYSSLTAPNILVIPANTSAGANTVWNQRVFYLSLTTAASLPATADIYVYGVLVPGFGAGGTFV